MVVDFASHSVKVRVDGGVGGWGGGQLFGDGVPLSANIWVSMYVFFFVFFFQGNVLS